MTLDFNVSECLMTIRAFRLLLWELLRLDNGNFFKSGLGGFLALKGIHELMRT